MNYFIFDVESVGLHGEGFAVAGGLHYENSAALWEFSLCCPIDECEGSDSDREWVKKNVPTLEVTHHGPYAMREQFWQLWEQAKKQNAVMAVECGWPVEARFLSDCVKQDLPNRNFSGPYPLQEIATFMVAAGMNPMEKYERQPSESREHDPLCDSRLSARLLAMALKKLNK